MFDSAVTLVDTPYKGIIEAATKRKCRVIFMASHGRRGVSGLFMGSVTRRWPCWAVPGVAMRQGVDPPAVVAAVGDGRMFTRGRDMAAWLGLVPRQHSTGGKPTLGPIGKRGDTYCVKLFVQGAQSSFVHLKRDQSSLGHWLRQVETRRQRQGSPTKYEPTLPGRRSGDEKPTNPLYCFYAARAFSPIFVDEPFRIRVSH